MLFLRYICLDFMQNFTFQVNFLARVWVLWRNRPTFFSRKRNKTWDHWMRNAFFPFLALFLSFEAVTVHCGKLSPFFLRHPLPSMHFWVTTLITNHDITLKMSDVPYVKPRWVLRCTFRFRFILSDEKWKI